MFIKIQEITEIQDAAAQEYPAESACQTRRLKAFYEFPQRPQRWLPLGVNRSLQNPLPECTSLQQGATLQIFLPIGHKKRVAMRQVLCNGIALKESKTNGYQLIKGECGWYLFLHFPAKTTQKQNLYCITALYDR